MKGSFGKTEAPFRLLLHNEELLIVAMNDFPFSFPLPDHDVQRLRARILTTLCAADEGFCAIPVASIRRQTLAQMLDLYDSLFFSGFLGRVYGKINVTLSQRLTSSAGKFMYVRGGASRLSQAEIRMSGDFLFRLSEGPFLLNGLSVATPQEAFLVVFEHELCHAAENALFGSTGHSSRFLSLAHGLFGHNDTRHSLPTRMQEAASEGLSPGVRVCFCYQGSVLRGIVTYIGKTATVMVEDRSGAYRDRQGRRYSKYRVPLGHLTVSLEKQRKIVHCASKIWKYSFIFTIY